MVWPHFICVCVCVTFFEFAHRLRAFFFCLIHPFVCISIYKRDSEFGHQIESKHVQTCSLDRLSTSGHDICAVIVLSASSTSSSICVCGALSSLFDCLRWSRQGNHRWSKMSTQCQQAAFLHPGLIKLRPRFVRFAFRICRFFLHVVDSAEPRTTLPTSSFDYTCQIKRPQPPSMQTFQLQPGPRFVHFSIHSLHLSCSCLRLSCQYRINES